MWLQTINSDTVIHVLKLAYLSEIISPWAVTLSWQQICMSKMASKIDQTELVFGLWSRFVSVFVRAAFL